jgi:hypothetical protein
MTLSKQKRTWELTDHVCIKCGGRILKCVTGNGMSPGGNPLYKCSCCSAATWGLGQPEELCWCGMHFKGQTENPYICLPFSILKEHPELESIFQSCGCDPKSGMDVGVGLRDELRKTIKENTV